MASVFLLMLSGILHLFSMALRSFSGPLCFLTFSGALRLFSGAFRSLIRPLYFISGFWEFVETKFARLLKMRSFFLLYYLESGQITRFRKRILPIY